MWVVDGFVEVDTGVHTVVFAGWADTKAGAGVGVSSLYAGLEFVVEIVVNSDHRVSASVGRIPPTAKAVGFLLVFV